MIAKYRKAEFPNEWWLTDFTMEQVEGQLNQLRRRNAELKADIARLTAALDAKQKEVNNAMELVFKEQAEVERLRDFCFGAGLMLRAPCFNCGYNGPGYFQPDKHPCAALHHAALRREVYGGKD